MRILINLIIVLFSPILLSSTAGALPLVHLGLPPLLDPVTKPVQALTTGLPVSISSEPTPDLQADVNVAPIANVQAQVNVPVSPAPTVVANPVRLAQAVVSSPTAPSADQQPTATVQKPTNVTLSLASQKDDASTVQPKSSPSLFGNVFTGINNIASALAGKQVGTLPIVVSTVIFFVTLATIGGIIYTSNHGGILTLGRLGTLNFSHYFVSHDMAQVAALTVGAFSLGIIAIFLTLAGL